MRLILPEDWGRPDPGSLVMHRRSPFAPCLDEIRDAIAHSENLFVIGTDGMASVPGWLLATDHIALFGDGPLVGPNDDSAGPRFPSLSGMYVTVEGGWRSGVVLRSPDWRLTTRAELSATGAAAAASEGVEEAIAAGHGGARAALLVRCHGHRAWNRTEPPLTELIDRLSRRNDN